RLYFAASDDMGGITITNIIDDNIESHEIEGTLLTIVLKKPLLPNSITILNLAFQLKIPLIFSRLGHKGNHYEITQWYPKACVYDDTGWHNDTYHYLGEFYSDFGNYDVTITLPSRYIVAATGEMYTQQIEDNSGNKKLYKSIRFVANNVHDFAWTADKDFTIKTFSCNNVVIETYVLSKHQRYWEDVGEWVFNALDLYSQWYGEYPYKSLKIVDVGDSEGAGMEYPGIVFISGNSIPFTRFHEAQVVHEIAHQWFYAMLATNEIEYAWLDEGFATFSEIRYFESVYGVDNNIFNLPSWLPLDIKLDKRTEAKYYYYMLASSGIEKPLNAPSYQHYENPFAYNSYYYKSALVLFTLRDQMGQHAFDAAIRHYCHKYRFKHPIPDDFYDICKEFSDVDLTYYFDQWIQTTATVDYSIKRIRSRKLENSSNINGNYQSRVYIKQKSDGSMPVEIVLTDEAGNKHNRSWSGTQYSNAVLTFYTDYPPKSAAIDPENKTLDYYRWNNHFPRKVKFKLLFDKPDLDAYQVFIIPYGWYMHPDNYLLGTILQGRQFFDSGSLLGKHQWMLFMAYDTDDETIRHAFDYQTPLGIWGKFTRIYGNWFYNPEEKSLTGGLRFAFIKKPFSNAGYHSVDVSGSYTSYSAAFESDPRDVDVGSFMSLNCDYGYKGGGIRFGGGWNLKGSWGKDVRNDVFEFGKISGEIYNYFRYSSLLKILSRFYIGYAHGTIPAQEQFFLSGKLFPDKMLSLTWANSGDLSSQERLHIWGDGNLRGYYGRHSKGKFIYSSTFEKEIPISSSYIFFDAGNIADSPDNASMGEIKSDFGLGIRLFNLIRLDFPIWISHPEKKEPYWDFRFIAGFTRGLS
ncbi:MAG: M1 family metallopeptidase, partial [candidate division Zixibacteria bacterium]|nr:M1 family metallopeptidase [candidate division Zixibacteria bacterium]